jgi:cytochrome c oxidase cbb3-type subunit 2
MPAYPHLLATKASATVGSDVDAKMVALRRVGVPYTDEDIAGAKEAIGDKTEMDVLVAYLQGLGTLLPNTAAATSAPAAAQ